MPACTTLPTVRPNPASSIKTLAILPVVNNTNDVDGPVVVRTIMAANMETFFYEIKPLDETDTVLKDQMGLTLGSQLDMATTPQLCEKLGTDAIVYGSLDDFNQKITGIYNSKRVRLRVKVDNCKTGATIWKNGIGVKRETRTSDSLLKNVPILGSAVSAAGAVASVVSCLSDKGDTALPKLCGCDIKAPWEDISEDNSTAEANLAFGLAGKVLGKAMNSPLLTETGTAITILLHGYYDDGAELIPYGTMLPTGPVVKVTNNATVK